MTIYLRHEDFPHELSRWIQSLISQAGGIPFHRPKGAVVERKGRTIAQCLFNNRAFMESFEYAKQPKCPCRKLAAMLPPRALTTSGHVAADVNDLEEAELVSPKFVHLLRSNTEETVAPTKQYFTQEILKAVERYTLANNLSLGPVGSPKQERRIIMQLINTQWTKHIEACQGAWQHRYETVKALRERFPEYIWQDEDHAYTKAVMYCPRQYHNQVCETFHHANDVFAMMDLSPEEAVSYVKGSLPEILRKGCGWAFCKAELSDEAYLPEGYSIPKRKKCFEKGRPIIPCVRNWLCKLHKACGRI